MRISIGEFILAAAPSHEGEEQALEKQLTQEIYLTLLEKHLTKLVEANAFPARSDSPVLHQLENVLLRYDKPIKWRNFLDGLRKRKRWWNKESERWTSAPQWIRTLWEWLPDEDGNLPTNNPADECLRNANQSMRQIYYPEDEYETSQVDAPLSEDDWETLEQQLSENLRIVVLRELLLRIVRRAIR